MPTLPSSYPIPMKAANNRKQNILDSEMELNDAYL